MLYSEHLRGKQCVMLNRLPLFSSMVKVALVTSSICGSEVRCSTVVLIPLGTGFGPRLAHLLFMGDWVTVTVMLWVSSVPGTRAVTSFLTILKWPKFLKCLTAWNLYATGLHKLPKLPYQPYPKQVKFSPTNLLSRAYSFNIWNLLIYLGDKFMAQDTSFRIFGDCPGILGILYLAVLA